MESIIHLTEEKLAQRIFFIRGEKVMLDFDLAELYGVETKRLKESVRRNMERFPEDFLFELSPDEYKSLRTQIASLKRDAIRQLITEKNEPRNPVGFKIKK